jgi:hypothetical protein
MLKVVSMGTTFASELLRELNNSQIDQIFVQTKQLLNQPVGVSLDFPQYEVFSAFPDAETEAMYQTDEADLVIYPDVAS